MILSYFNEKYDISQSVAYDSYSNDRGKPLSQSVGSYLIRQKMSEITWNNGLGKRTLFSSFR